jgi:hypothetical protein
LSVVSKRQRQKLTSKQQRVFACAIGGCSGGGGGGGANNLLLLLPSSNNLARSEGRFVAVAAAAALARRFVAVAVAARSKLSVVRCQEKTKTKDLPQSNRGSEQQRVCFSGSGTAFVAVAYAVVKLRRGGLPRSYSLA